MPDKARFPDMPPNKSPTLGNVDVEISMIGFIYGGLLARIPLIAFQAMVLNRTKRRNARWLVRLTALFFSVSLLAACAPKTEEEQIAAINKGIAPDGHLTKTHLYIHWPAVYTEARRNDPGGKEIVPAVTLKIPIEYLGQHLISFENAAKIRRHDAGIPETKESSAIDYSSRINQALSIHDHQITRIYLRVQPGAKPYVPLLPYKSDTPEVADLKFNQFVSAYAVHIERNDYFAIPLSDRTEENPYEKPPRFDCSLEEYCHVSFGIKGRHVEIRGVGEALDSFYKDNVPPSSQKPSKSFQSLPDQIQTGLPKWHEKVDPAQALVNSFVLPEDSLEVKTLFANP